MSAGKLWPVVAADPDWLMTALLDDLLQNARDPPAGKAGIHLQTQTLSRMRTCRIEQAKSPATADRIGQEAQCPLLIRETHRRERFSHLYRPLASAAFPRQSRFLVNTEYPLGVHRRLVAQ